VADADQETIHGLRLLAEVDHAIIDQLLANGDLDREKIVNLETALVTARRIGAAIGVLMSRHQVTDAQAFNLLREASQMNPSQGVTELARFGVVGPCVPKSRTAHAASSPWRRSDEIMRRPHCATPPP
jgi:hypothetical protein